MPSAAPVPTVNRWPFVPLALLLAFAMQCLWVASHAPLDTLEQHAVSAGPVWENKVASDDPALRGDAFRGPLFYRIARLPQRIGLVTPFDFVGPMYHLRARLRLPFLLIGVLFGGSIWYVGRRLYTPLGAAFALTLYCFSPTMIAASSHVRPDILASWGYFGAIFLAIASAHSLYALRETLPWHRRWWRPVLMGFALGIGVACQYSLWVAAPLALAFVLYLVPGPRLEGVAMVAAAAAIGTVVFLATFHFDWNTFGAGALNAPIRPALAWNADTLSDIRNSEAWVFQAMLLIAVITWFAWRRARYFGNTAAWLAAAAVPLTVAGGLGDWLWQPALALLFLFVGGIFADLAETRRRRLVVAVGLALLFADIGVSLAYRLRTPEVTPCFPVGAFNCATSK